MNKKEMARVLRNKVSEVIRRLPDVEYHSVSLFQDITTTEDIMRESHIQRGNIHSIEIGIEEVRDETV